MPRRKRHYVLCKKGLHSLERWGGIKLTKRKPFQRKQFVTRFCLLCRRTYQRNYMRQHAELKKGAKKLAPLKASTKAFSSTPEALLAQEFHPAYSPLQQPQER
jgi:hypothetical protein